MKIIETVTRLRNAARDNVKAFCEEFNEDYEEVLEYITTRAEEKTMLGTPMDFYIELYNESLKLK